MVVTNPMAKEMAIRRRILGIFNKREDDFPSLRDYNDYLEEVENMTFNLIEGIDVAEVEANIAKYQEENAELIIINRARRAEELAAALKASRRGSVQADSTDALKGAGTSGQVEVSIGKQGSYAPAAAPGGAFAQPRPLQPVPVGGPLDPLHSSAAEDEETKKLRAERCARAGGWTIELGKKRSMEEAFSSLTF